MKDHTAISNSPSQRFGVFHQCCPDTLALELGNNGYLPHLNITARTWPQNKTSHQPVAKMAGKVMRILLGLQLLN